MSFGSARPPASVQMAIPRFFACSRDCPAGRRQGRPGGRSERRGSGRSSRLRPGRGVHHRCRVARAFFRHHGHTVTAREFPRAVVGWKPRPRLPPGDDGNVANHAGADARRSVVWPLTGAIAPGLERRGEADPRAPQASGRRGVLPCESDCCFIAHVRSGSPGHRRSAARPRHQLPARTLTSSGSGWFDLLARVDELDETAVQSDIVVMTSATPARTPRKSRIHAPRTSGPIGGRPGRIEVPRGLSAEEARRVLTAVASSAGAAARSGRALTLRIRAGNARRRQTHSH